MRGSEGFWCCGGEKGVRGEPGLLLDEAVPAEVRFIMLRVLPRMPGDLMLEDPEVREDLDCEVDRDLGLVLLLSSALGALSLREKSPMAAVAATC